MNKLHSLIIVFHKASLVLYNITTIKYIKSYLSLFLIIPCFAYGDESVCHGTTSKGSLEHGVELPKSGTNFVTYSDFARMVGRSHVHSEVKEIVVAAYASLVKDQPDKVYKYAETGFKNGGPFNPHKTHMNGLSVDFMSPVITENGKSVHLPTSLRNKFGYSIEFDTSSKYEDLVIDYDAFAAHIVALDKAAKSRGHKIWRVIFDPLLQPGLLKTQFGSYIKANIQLSKKPSWIRHDEHYHVDFKVPCAK